MCLVAVEPIKGILFICAATQQCEHYILKGKGIGEITGVLDLLTVPLIIISASQIFVI